MMGTAWAVRATAALVVSVGLCITVLAGVGSAHAVVQFTVAGDGGRGVLAYAYWADDNMPVAEAVEATLEAYRDDGTYVGPVTLRPAPEGGSFYRADLPADTPTGPWRVLIQAHFPAPGATEATLQVGEQATGFPSPLPIPVPKPAAGGGLPWGLVLGIAAAMLIGVAAVMTIARRRFRDRATR
jgi:hypothetical protein